jgi:hypothetical protein
MPSSLPAKNSFHASFMRSRFVRKSMILRFPYDAALPHVHFPETQLYVSCVVDALLDLLEWGEEDHVDQCRASDTHSKACSFYQLVFFAQTSSIGLPLYDPGWKNLMSGRVTWARPVSSWRFWNWVLTTSIG